MEEATNEWKFSLTGAGWQCLSFTDAFRQPCRLHQSNLIDGTARAMEHPGSSALRLGLDNGEREMVLHRSHVKQLIEVMQRWLDTHELNHVDKRQPATQSSRYLVSAVYEVDRLEVLHPMQLLDSEEKAEAFVVRLFNQENLGHAVWAITGKLNSHPKAIRILEIGNYGTISEEPLDVRSAEEAHFTTV